MTLWALPILFFSATIWAQEPAAAPFWKAKEKIYERISNGEIIVSVTSQKSGDALKKNRLKMAAGGQLAVPLDYAFRRAMDLNSLSKFSEYVKSAQYDGTTKKLKLEVQAYGYHTHLDMTISTQEKPEEKWIDFIVDGGPLKGMQGRLSLLSLGKKKTETGYAATFDYDRLPIPKLFVEFGMEVVIKRMGFLMRRTMEQEYGR